MRFLFEFANRGDFREFVEITMENPAVQGITVDVDRTWLYAEKLRRQLPPGYYERFEISLYQQVVDGLPLHSFPFFLPEMERLRKSLPSEPLNWSWLPAWWDDYCTRFRRNYRMPIVVRVCMLPWNREQRPVPTERWEFPIVVEHRPQARLCSTKKINTPVVGGLSIGVTTVSSGTLGGIIEDQRGDRFGVTCSHVASVGDPIDQPAQSDSTSVRGIGSVSAATQLLVSSRTTPCSPRNPNSRLNKNDAALVPLGPTISSDLKILTLGGLSRVFPEADLNPGDTLYFVGKESGPKKRELVVGGLNVVYRFSGDGVNFYTFENTFQVEWPSTSNQLGTEPVEDGDSGAWLCCPDGYQHAWAGMVLGCHRDIGYALFSERVMSWVDQQLKHGPGKVT